MDYTKNQSNRFSVQFIVYHSRHCLRTAQMHKMGTLGKLPCQFMGIILFPVSNEPT